MDSYKVNITKQAEESMRNISLYIAQNLMNVSAAEGHVDAFLNAIENYLTGHQLCKQFQSSLGERRGFAG